MKSPISKLLFVLFAVFYSLASNANSTAKNLTLIEQKIAQTIDSTKQNYLSVLERTVNINSGTMNFEGVKETGKVMQKEFDKLGFETRWIDGKAFNRAGHLYASFGVDSRSNNKKVLLIGHLDTVFASNSPFQSYKELGATKIAGPGITDMKGGNVIILSILDALKKHGALEKLQVKIMLMGDEEKRGAPYQVATKELVEAGKWADIAMGFEDGDGDPKTAVISRRGAIGWKLTVKGRPAHSSQIFREGYGYGAIFETARILNAFREELAKEPNLTFNPGVIVGGTDVEFDKASAAGTAFGKSNVISETTIVHGDIRALSPEQLEFAHNTMKKIVKENLADTTAELVFYDGYPPMAPNDGNRKLLAMYDLASQDLGFGKVLPVDPRKAGAADVSFVANHVEMALDGLGLMGTGGHTVKEVADITTFTSQAKRAAILLHRFAHQEK
ncbi:MAG: M20/M25/M40 family metallo-hydrolase [Kangiellaceae bacterium]